MKAWSAEVEHDNGPPEDQPSLRLATRSGVPGLLPVMFALTPSDQSAACVVVHCRVLSVVVMIISYSSCCDDGNCGRSGLG
jgi:hypothetical protein